MAKAKERKFTILSMFVYPGGAQREWECLFVFHGNCGSWTVFSKFHSSFYRLALMDRTSPPKRLAHTFNITFYDGSRLSRISPSFICLSLLVFSSYQLTHLSSARYCSAVLCCCLWTLRENENIQHIESPLLSVDNEKWISFFNLHTAAYESSSSLLSVRGYVRIGSDLHRHTACMVLRSTESESVRRGSGQVSAVSTLNWTRNI